LEVQWLGGARVQDLHTSVRLFFCFRSCPRPALAPDGARSDTLRLPFDMLRTKRGRPEISSVSPHPTHRPLKANRLRIWGSGVRISSGAPSNLLKPANQSRLNAAFSLGFSLWEFSVRGFARYASRVRTAQVRADSSFIAFSQTCCAESVMKVARLITSASLGRTVNGLSRAFQGGGLV
jgi:hypothetical protein